MSFEWWKLLANVLHSEQSWILNPVNDECSNYMHFNFNYYPFEFPPSRMVNVGISTQFSTSRPIFSLLFSSIYPLTNTYVVYRTPEESSKWNPSPILSKCRWEGRRDERKRHIKSELFTIIHRWIKGISKGSLCLIWPREKRRSKQLTKVIGYISFILKLNYWLNARQTFLLTVVLNQISRW